MHDQLKAAMAALEGLQEQFETTPAIHQAALAGLGSKFLAIGSPSSLGLIGCGPAAQAIDTCHEILFGALALRCAGDNELAREQSVTSCSIEEGLACDIVSISTTEDFSMEWIPEATHLNIVDTGPWSAGMQRLARDAHITWLGEPRHALAKGHGSLADVIRGIVSGRMSEEITGLLWTPKRAMD
jgi:ornithine cyclodeaminase/alanine dehydrogenase-like protein (mu-crystallin family)